MKVKVLVKNFPPSVPKHVLWLKASQKSLPDIFLHPENSLRSCHWVFQLHPLVVSQPDDDDDDGDDYDDGDDDDHDQDCDKNDDMMMMMMTMMIINMMMMIPASATP